jgi:hypothetical protein
MDIKEKWQEIMDWIHLAYKLDCEQANEPSGSTRGWTLGSDNAHVTLSITNFCCNLLFLFCLQY